MPHKALSYLTYEASMSTTLRNDLGRVREENVNLLAEAETNRGLTEERNDARARVAALGIESTRLSSARDVAVRDLATRTAEVSGLRTTLDPAQTNLVDVTQERDQFQQQLLAMTLERDNARADLVLRTGERDAVTNERDIAHDRLARIAAI